MTYDLVLALLGFALVSVGTPGPNNMMLLASGANFGLKRSLPHMAGVGMGVPVMIMILGQGALALFDKYPWLETTLMVASVAYLLWLAWKIANAAAPSDQKVGGRPMTFLQALAFQWVNPKAWTMSVGAITIYAPDQTQLALLGVASAFLAMAFISTTTWVTLGQKLRTFLTSSARLRAFNWTMAGLMIVSMGYALVTT